MRISQRNLRDVFLLGMGLLVIALGTWYVLHSPKPKPKQLTCTGGSEVGLRHKLAFELAPDAKRNQIELILTGTSGSEDALQQVESGAIDLALVQGGLNNETYQHVQEVTPLHVEPLHLLVKPTLAEAIARRGLAALGGHSINVGTLASGTCALSQEFLNFLGLTAVSDESALLDDHQYRVRHRNYEDLLTDDDGEQLSDAIFTISSLPSPIVKHLVEQYAYQLVPLPLSDAFSLDAYVYRHPQSGASRFDKRRIHETSIPAFTYSVSLAQPPQRLTTFGTRLLLVANDRVAADSIDQLLQAIYQSSLTKDARPPIDISAMNGRAEFPWHAGALRFIQHHKPLIAGEVMGVLDNSLAIIATLMGGAFFLTQWYFRRRQRHREQEFQAYFDAVMNIEHELLAFDLEAQMKVVDLLDLRQRLSDLKSDVVSKFSRGDIEGERLMLGFMTMANDARNHITRLLLHERENVEATATHENRSVEDLWLERVRATAAANSQSASKAKDE